MIADGKQIRAARALLGWSQSVVAERAGVHVNSVKYWERRGASVQREETGLKAIREALEGQGIEFVQGGAVMHEAVR